MFFLSLSLGEFVGALGLVGGVITALYLFDRAKRKRVVSTLRFWSAAPGAEERQSRRKMRDPWSLALQLASLLLLLLALAQLQWGKRDERGRDNLLLLDTSSWTAQKTGGRTVLDREKELAQRYIAALRATDRLMLVRVDALATPVTPFTADRSEVGKRLAESNSSFSALNISQALSLAEQAQSWSNGRSGEVVYIGPKLIDEADSPTPSLPNLRIIPVETSPENSGIRGVGIKRSEEDANAWQALVTLKNYGREPRPVRLEAKFAGTRFATRPLLLEPGQERVAEYNFVTNSAGRFVARIMPGDSLASDDRCEIELPKDGFLKLAVFSKRPQVLRPLFQANRMIDAKFFPPELFGAKQNRDLRSADMVLLDGFAPSETPTVPALWIDPPRERSPLPVKAVVSDAAVTNWHSETALGEGMHAKGGRIPQAEVFQTFEGDLIVGSVAEGPIVVARDSNRSRPRQAAIGFDPLNGELRFQVTTPLLFANLLRWLAPESFRTFEVDAGHVGAASVVLDPAEVAKRISVRDDSGLAVPFTASNGLLEIFAGQPAIVHVISDDRERVLSLTLPDVSSAAWNPQKPLAVGLPVRSRFVPGALDLWQWLALLGGGGLLAEWLLFGRGRPLGRRNLPDEQQKRGSTRAAARNKAPKKDEELVSR